MAGITLETYHFIHPAGELQKAQFPDEDLESSLLPDWLAQAANKAAVLALETSAEADEAAEHWVYYRAYGAIARRIGAVPTSDAYFSNQVQRTWGKDRVEYWQSLAREALDSYRAAVGGSGVDDGVPVSSSAVARAAW